jgi:DNA helicase IV
MADWFWEIEPVSDFAARQRFLAFRRKLYNTKHRHLACHPSPERPTPGDSFRVRTLKRVVPTPEQLPIISRTRAGVEIIVGAAGSGKTTTALLRLRSLVGLHLSRRERLGDSSPVRVLVLTYNRTLRGYIDALVQEEAQHFVGAELVVSTFGSWSRSSLGNPRVLDDDVARANITALGYNLGLPTVFLNDEVEYILGRFRPEDLPDYAVAPRVGRGRTPRLDRSMRQRILDDVVWPYREWKMDHGGKDWNDLAIQIANTDLGRPLDVVIADETQDFSANQIRAVIRQLAATHNVTFVLDAAQRIYARGFTWAEVGVTLRPENVHRLAINYRNTVEIARFAAPLLRNLPLDDDGTIPDFNVCRRHGPLPVVVKGRFGRQLEYVMNYLRQIDLTAESVVFLHPKGGGWFDYTRSVLERAGYAYAEITRQSEWPTGDENIALSTLHSAKGLEFDHVFMLGLNSETMAHGDDPEDDRLDMHRRLLAMAVGRARISVVLGYKAGEASQIVDFLDPDTFTEVNV